MVDRVLGWLVEDIKHKVWHKLSSPFFPSLFSFFRRLDASLVVYASTKPVFSFDYDIEVFGHPTSGSFSCVLGWPGIFLFLPKS